MTIEASCSESGPFAYDAAGRMLEAPEPVGLEAATYNEQGLPTSMALEGTSVTYRYSADGQRTYKQVEGSGETNYVKDHLGSIRAVLDGGGTVKERRSYYPFGLPLPERHEVEGTQEDYTGHVKDEASQCHYPGSAATEYTPGGTP